MTEIPDREVNFAESVGRSVSRKGRVSRNFRRNGLKNVYTEHN